MKLLLVEDHPIVVRGCLALFTERPDIQIFVAGTIEAARKYLTEHTFHVAVIDDHLPDASGLEFIREYKKAQNGKVIFFSMADEPAIAMRAIDYGAQACVSKNASSTILLKAVDAVTSGGIWFSEELIQDIALRRVGQSADQPKLSARQLSVLELLASGLRPREIARDLNITLAGVASDLKAVRNKFNARTDPEMVAIAIKKTLLARRAIRPQG